jgi:hypothetical protein
MHFNVSPDALPMLGIGLPLLERLEIPVGFRLRALDSFDGSAPLFAWLRIAIVHLFDELRPHMPVRDDDEDKLS